MNWPPLQKPAKKDPALRTRVPLSPPASRSRAALGLVSAAAQGLVRLQVCAACEVACYPPRDACPRCFGVDLPWRDVAPEGEAIAQTTIRVATDPYFRERLPWRVGTIAFHGVSLVANLHRDVVVPGRVRITVKLDRAGNPVFFALPPEDTPLMNEDAVLRELTADPHFRRILISDGRHPVGQALIPALQKAGAAKIFVGVAEDWRPFEGQAQLRKLAAEGAIELVTLDVTDAKSLAEAAGAVGGKVDILVNTAERLRAGGVLTSQGLNEQREAFEVNVHGLARLAQAFGHGMRARGADGQNSAVAIVDILPIHALVNAPAYGAFCASAAARHSLLQCLRAEMRAGGVRVIGIYAGPLEEAWRQELPPPKVTPKQIADVVVRALKEGLEEVAVGDVAKDILARHLADPKTLEREMSQ